MGIVPCLEEKIYNFWTNICTRNMYVESVDHELGELPNYTYTN